MLYCLSHTPFALAVLKTAFIPGPAWTAVLLYTSYIAGMIGTHHSTQTLLIDMGVLWTFLLWLTSNGNLHYLCLSNSYDYRHEPTKLTSGLILFILESF
jgi:hypothetical protein